LKGWQGSREWDLHHQRCVRLQGIVQGIASLHSRIESLCAFVWDLLSAIQAAYVVQVF
jgi:hypothetical protein